MHRVIWDNIMKIEWLRQGVKNLPVNPLASYCFGWKVTRQVRLLRSEKTIWYHIRSLLKYSWIIMQLFLRVLCYLTQGLSFKRLLYPSFVGISFNLNFKHYLKSWTSQEFDALIAIQRYVLALLNHSRLIGDKSVLETYAYIYIYISANSIRQWYFF